MRISRFDGRSVSRIRGSLQLILSIKSVESIVDQHGSWLIQRKLKFTEGMN